MSDEVIDEISDILLETPLDGIVATNGTHRREGLHTSRMALDKIGSGRLSGAPLAQRAVEVVRRIHTRSGGNFPIIGVGGIMSPADAKAMLDAAQTSCNSTPVTSTKGRGWSAKSAVR